MLYGGALTRYDGWFSAAVLDPFLAWLFSIWYRRTQNGRQRRTIMKSFVEVLLLNALVPVYWLVYTWAVSGNALDFINGPYSAKAIALRTTAKGAPPYPGQDHAFTAGLYFLKSAQLNMGNASWGHFDIDPGVTWHSDGGVALPPVRISATPVVAAAVLFAVDRLWQRAYLYSGVVSVLVLQRTLWNGTAAGACGISCCSERLA